MALSDILDMSNSASLQGRIQASAAMQGESIKWVNSNLLRICATSGWDTAWAAGVAQGGNYNPDTGARTDVISDQMIHDGVAAIITADATSTADQPAQPNA